MLKHSHLTNHLSMKNNKYQKKYTFFLKNLIILNTIFILHININMRG